jgi:hypothetical protein
MELVEAFTPLKATVTSKDVQLWTDYRDNEKLALDLHFGVKYFGNDFNEDSKEREEGEPGEREEEFVEGEEEFSSEGIRLRTRSNLIICADPKKCQFAVKKKHANASMMFEKGLTRLAVAASSSNCAGIADVQELLQNMICAQVPVMLLVGVDIVRDEANELINISRTQLWLMVVRALGLIPSSATAFPVSRSKKFGHDFWFENGIAAAADNKIRYESEMIFKD